MGERSLHPVAPPSLAARGAAVQALCPATSRREAGALPEALQIGEMQERQGVGSRVTGSGRAIFFAGLRRFRLIVLFEHCLDFGQQRIVGCLAFKVGQEQVKGLLGLWRTGVEPVIYCVLLVPNLCQQGIQGKIILKGNHWALLFFLVRERQGQPGSWLCCVPVFLKTISNQDIHVDRKDGSICW